jgi:hypothetical protein
MCPACAARRPDHARVRAALVARTPGESVLVLTARVGTVDRVLPGSRLDDCGAC